MPQDLLSLLGILLVLLLVLGGSYLFTRWAGSGLMGRLGAGAAGRHVRVLERVSLGRDQALLVVQAANRYFLLGSSPSGFSLLAELTEEEGALWSSPPPPDASAQEKAPDFRAMIKRLREKK